MEIEKARKIMEEYDKLRIEDSRAYDKKNRVTIIESLNIIAKHDPDDDTDFECQHDQMWFGSFEESVEKMSEIEYKQLLATGWFEDDNSWSHFA